MNGKQEVDQKTRSGLILIMFSICFEKNNNTGTFLN